MLILGPSKAGKTALFNRLVEGEVPDSVTSLEANRAECWPVPGTDRSARLVAWPGHPKLRAGLSALLPSVAGVVFLVDGTDFNPHLRVIAELFMETVGSRAVAGARVPVYLGINKCDRGAKCHTHKFVRSRLEQEVQKLLDTRGSMMDTDGGEQARLNLGKQSGKFSLEGLCSRVTVGTLSVVSGDNLESLDEWVRESVLRA